MAAYTSFFLDVDYTSTVIKCKNGPAAATVRAKKGGGDEMLELDNADSAEVKGLDLKTPIMCDFMTGETEETKEEVHYNIPRTDGNLPFYQDFFALARLLKDYSQCKVTGNRLPWNNHILSDASFAHAFCDLDKKLFGDFEAKELFDSMENNANKAYFANCTREQLYKDFIILYYLDILCPDEIRGKLLVNLYNLNKKASALTSQFGPMTAIGNAWYRFRSIKSRDENGVYYRRSFGWVVDNYLDAVFRLKKSYPNLDIFNPLYGLAWLLHDKKDLLLPPLRDRFFNRALCKLRQHPNGPTILWHVGLGPKPEKLYYAGMQFGFLTVEAPADPIAKREGRIVNREAVTARCACGKTIKVALADLSRGRVISCGSCGRPKSLTAKTVQVWAKATIQNGEANKAERRQRHGYDFVTSHDLLYYCGLWPKPMRYDLSRIDDHVADTPYAPGRCFWQDKAVNRAVETKALHTFSELNRQVMLEEIPAFEPDSAPFDPSVADLFFDPEDDSL